MEPEEETVRNTAGGVLQRAQEAISRAKTLSSTYSSTRRLLQQQTARLVDTADDAAQHLIIAADRAPETLNSHERDSTMPGITMTTAQFIHHYGQIHSGSTSPGPHSDVHTGSNPYTSDLMTNGDKVASFASASAQCSNHSSHLSAISTPTNQHGVAQNTSTDSHSVSARQGLIPSRNVSDVVAAQIQRVRSLISSSRLERQSFPLPSYSCSSHAHSSPSPSEDHPQLQRHSILQTVNTVKPSSHPAHHNAPLPAPCCHSGACSSPTATVAHIDHTRESSPHPTHQQTPLNLACNHAGLCSSSSATAPQTDHAMTAGQGGRGVGDDETCIISVPCLTSGDTQPVQQCPTKHDHQNNTDITTPQHSDQHLQTIVHHATHRQATDACKAGLHGSSSVTCVSHPAPDHDINQVMDQATHMRHGLHHSMHLPANHSAHPSPSVMNPACPHLGQEEHHSQASCSEGLHDQSRTIPQMAASSSIPRDHNTDAVTIHRSYSVPSSHQRTCGCPAVTQEQATTQASLSADVTVAAEPEVAPPCAGQVELAVAASSGGDDGSAGAAGGSSMDGGLTGLLLDMLTGGRVAKLEQQQRDTLQQLMSLRLEQLRLRMQQLQALQGLLHTELTSRDASPLQVSTVVDALNLLDDSIRDLVRAASGVVGCTTLREAAALGDTVTGADKGAEIVCKTARRLLTVLREFPRRAPSALDVPAGATEAQLSSIASHVCEADSALCGELCTICLSCFNSGCTMKLLPCSHGYHSSCIDQWLRRRASCPLCLTSLFEEESS